MNKETYPILPLRDIVVYPKMIVPLFVGREKSIKALQQAIDNDQNIVLATQKEAAVEDPKPEDIFKVGTLGTVVQLVRLPDGTVKVLVEGLERVKIDDFIMADGFMQVDVEILAEDNVHDVETEALSRAVLSQFEEYVKLSKKVPPEVLVSVSQIEDYNKLADTIASHLSLKINEKQALLEGKTLKDRFNKILEFMDAEITLLEVENKIKSRVKKQMEKSQKEYYLNEQMRAIQKELGDGDEESEIDAYMQKIEKTKLSKEAREKALAEVKKLKTMSMMSAEATVVRNYLDWLLDIPWHKRSKVNKDLKKAAEILDADHYGLEKVKERIIEYLAVQSRADKVKGPILCLFGPPGVGKTSLGKSIARATGRSFVRTSLGGMRDEAEIRGHRRTYIGSMPGKIIKGMKKAGTSNPLFLLDEIDKLGSDWRGDPSSALLEVLDAEQNRNFRDHYVEIPIDLSEVLFVVTANTTETIPRPLLDRMEVIEVSSYTAAEKFHIAREHLMPKQLKKNGMQGRLIVSDNALRSVIEGYTREAGVRGLERKLGEICRKAARELLKEDKSCIRVNDRNLEKYLGKPRFHSLKANQTDEIGIVRGLAWTSVGGDTLQIEVNMMPGKGELELTGQLGDVMKESAMTGLSYIRSVSERYQIDPDVFKKNDFHIHIPEGAVPKDGPSAGITMATALLSALTHTPVRADLAMTGEITLRGRVLPIGGLKEKTLAAKTAGIKTVLVPEKNRPDVEEIPAEIKNGLEILFVETMDDVIAHAFVGGKGNN